MKMAMTAAAALSLAAGVATAETVQFSWTPAYSGSGGFGLNNNGGQFESVTSTFNDNTNRLTFEVVFSNQVTEGITLAINNGSNPKGHNREMALFYLDAKDQGDVKMTAYVYSGQNNANSYQTQDLLESTEDTSWINSLTATDSNGKRTLAFDVDVTDIIGYSNDQDWTGAQFSTAFGIWLHTFRQFDVTYDSSNGPNRGGISNLSRGGEGWLDGGNLDVQIIPLPGAAAMAGLGLAGVGMRRRRA